MRIVKIKWVDSSSDGGRWTRLDDIDNDILDVVSVGFIVKETDRQITLALNNIITPEEEQYCQMISIPKVAITKIDELGEI